MVCLILALHVRLVRDGQLLLLVLIDQKRLLAMRCYWCLLQVLLDLYLVHEERVILDY